MTDDKNNPKMIYRIKEHRFLVVDGKKAYIVDCDLDKVPKFLDYVSYTLIVISVLFIIFNYYIVAAYVFIFASIIILASYYFNKVVVRRKVKNNALKRDPLDIEEVRAKQGIRSYDIKVIFSNDEKKNVDIILNYRSWLELQKELKKNNVLVKIQK